MTTAPHLPTSGTKTPNASSSGQTLLELLLAIAIFSSLTILLILSVSHLVKRQAQGTKNLLASFYLQQTTEKIYTISQTTQWDQLTPSAQPYYLQSAGNNSGWNVTTTDPQQDPYESKIFVKTAYRNSQGDLDPNCQANPGNCTPEAIFKELNIEIFSRPPGTNPEATAVYFLAPPSTFSPIGMGPTPDPNTIPPPVVTQHWDIISSPDDGEVDELVTEPKFAVGGDSGDQSGMRFVNLSIPQGSTIINAYIVAKSRQNYPANNSFSFRINGDKNPDNPNFSSLLPSCSNRTCTTAFTTYAAAGEWLQGNWYSLGDISTIVQEIVNQPIWMAGKALTFLFQGTGPASSDRDVYSYDSSSSNAAQLYVNFITPTPTPTPIPPTPTPLPPTPTPTPASSCVSTGGTMITFPDDCVDYCPTGGSVICNPNPTFSCDCGPANCWNGTACVPNPPSCASAGQSCSFTSCCVGLSCVGPPGSNTCQ